MEEKWMSTAYRHPAEMPDGNLATVHMTRDEYEQMVREQAVRNACEEKRRSEH